MNLLKQLEQNETTNLAMQHVGQLGTYSRAYDEQRHSVVPSGFDRTLAGIHPVLVQQQLEQLEQLKRLKELTRKDSSPVARTSSSSSSSSSSFPHGNAASLSQLYTADTQSSVPAAPFTVGNHSIFHLPQALRGSGTSVFQEISKIQAPLVPCSSSSSSIAEASTSKPTMPLEPTRHFRVDVSTNKTVTPTKSGSTQNHNSKKKLKDAHKPKHPLSAYNFFFRDERLRILHIRSDNETCSSPNDTNRGAVTVLLSLMDKTNTLKSNTGVHASHSGAQDNISFVSLSNVIGKRWKDLSKEKLIFYKDLAAKDLVRYKTEMASYKLLSHEDCKRN